MRCRAGHVFGLDEQCRLSRLPVPEREYKFHPSRNWRADYCWPDRALIVEVQGGMFRGGKGGGTAIGGHNSATGYLRDVEKFAEAVCLGYRVLMVTPRMVENGQALAYVERILKEV